MASKQARSIRNNKDKPNRSNMRKKLARIKKNLEILDRPLKEVRDE